MMETSRKRQLEGEEVVSSKKRVTSSGKVQAQVNGKEVNDTEMPTDENLELFRKGAIYRRMKHYARSCERAEQAVADLEVTRATYAAGIAAMDACWTLLNEKLRSLVTLSEAEQSPPSNSSLYDIVVAGSLDDELSDALQKRGQETEELFRAAKLPREASNQSALASRCESLQTENIVMHAQVKLLRDKLSDSEAAVDKIQERLDRAESRLDRVLSEAAPSRSPSHPVEPCEVLETIKLGTGTPDHANSPAAPNSKIPDEITDLHTLLDVKEAHIKQLAEQVSQLNSANRALKQQLVEPTEEILQRSTVYKSLLDQSSVSVARLNELNERVQHLQAEYDELRISRLELEEQYKADSKARAEEFKVQLAKRDVDLNRIRENRDTLQAELHDKKILMQAQGDGQRLAKNLANTRYERIKSLNKEVSRLRRRLAVQAGDEDLLKFLLSEGDSETSLSESLIRQNRDLQAHLDATEGVLSQAANSADMRAKVQERVTIVELESKLRKYETSFGTSPEMLDLTSRLESQAEEIRRCRLSMEAKEQEILSQQAALDQLATAWETLNEKVEAKVVEASVMEDKLDKLASEKAKADNKYFATMRIKDQLDTEKKALSRTLEKQAKTIERYLENEGCLKLQLINQSKEISQHEGTNLECRQTVIQLETAMKRLQYHKDGLEAKLSELSRSISIQESDHRESQSSRRKVEEQLSLCRTELERLKNKASTPTVVQGDKETVRKLDNCMKLLTCSTCKENFRNRLLSKCLHTFCEFCLDARISTRQRKCPACNLAFSVSDVQQLYFQG